MGNPLRLFRSCARGCAAWTLVVLILGPFLMAPTAQAIPTTVVEDVPKKVDSVLDTIFTTLTRAAMVGLFNAFQTFLGQLAYDAADYIATGGSGQSSTYYNKSFGTYLANVASDAAGEFIGSLSSEEFFQGAGFNLCRPDPRAVLRLQLSLGNFFPGVQGRFQRPRPRCDFKEIINNYDRLYQTLSNEDVLKNVQLSVNTNSSDLGVAFNIFNQYQKKIATNVDDRARERTEGAGFKSINNFVSGNIKTPAQVVNESAREQLVKFPNASLLTTVGATLSSGLQQGFIQLAAYTASIFVNTLTSKLLKRVFEEGLDIFGGPVRVSLGADEVPAQRQTDARSLSQSLKTPNLQKVETFDVVTELASCPNEGRGTWNCTIDQGLRSSLVGRDEGGMTIRAALSAGLLHGDWQLIPASDIRRNQDRDCYTRAYCAGNLQKLRVLRLLPVGFEFAANSPENLRRCGAQGAGCVTLAEVVDGFNNCSGSEASPWCRLIDPNWVLTALPQQCVLKGYGDQLISRTLGQRREECQDVQTCLRRNDAGECVGGYGYCVADKSVYRFGADECLPREASCRNYDTRNGQSASYLRNTTDLGNCGADNVGCLWYATTRDPGLGQEGWIGTPTSGPRIYFNKEVEGCNASGEGCTRVREIITGRPSLNLLLNPSFERSNDRTPPAPKDWLLSSAAFAADPPSTSPAVAEGSAFQNGERSADINRRDGSRGVYAQPVKMAPSRSYVLSAYVRTKTAGRASSFDALLVQQSDLNFDTRHRLSGQGNFHSSGCAVRGGVRSAGLIVPAEGRTLSTDWQRFECTFVSTSSTKMAGVYFTGDNILIDSVQLEEGEYATDFVDGLNTSLAERNLKIAPDEFACNGTETDHPLCARFAKVCRQVEAGCQGYTDVAGGREIPAILSKNDLCPAECVGYAEYRKGPSSFDLVPDADERFSDTADTSTTPFIPSTAASCRREEVGCEAFTNMEGTSGEQQAYFTYTRSCRKPSASSQTFFTWEGSDTAGYQLRTWSLVRDTATPPQPLIVTKREPGRLTIKEPITCNESTWRTAVDPDCRQFYDAEGRVSYRYYSQTVLSTPECTDYRIGRSTRMDCEKTDGVFDASSNECLYRVYVPQSRLCTAAAVGCREYRGVAAGASTPIYSEAFRDATTTRGFVGGRLSTESLLVGDQSLRIDVPSATRINAAKTIPTMADQSYTLTFWAKPALATSTIQLILRHPTDNSRDPIVIGAIQLGTDWQRYTFGPFNGYPNATSSMLVWSAPGQRNPYVVFLDEISITRVQDVVYARRDSWTTPLVCDQNAYGVPQPQAMLGCRAYRNRDSQTVNVKQFARLCREAVIGCKAYVDTRNSSDVGSETVTRGDLIPTPEFGVATTTREADRVVYLIDDPSKRCTADQNSCRAFGKPQFAPDRQTITGFTTVYLKDDIARYNRILCRPSELFCEEFTYNNAKEYFRDPVNHVCEYREDVTGVVGVPAGTYSGWFQAGVNPARPCYPELLESGRTFGIARRADPAYRGWVGMCPEAAGECTELRDPVDTSDPGRPSGKPYYFIRNERLDTTTCAGNVDTGNGCILMRDTSVPNNRYNARATYNKQQTAARAVPVQPLDCERNPADPNCRLQPGHCVGTIKYCDLSDTSCARPFSEFRLEFAEAIWELIVPPAELPRYRSLVTCRQDNDCSDRSPQRAFDGGSNYLRTGTCQPSNDANLIVKVNMDRDCAQWLGCSSSEVVFDPATNRSRNLCTNLALCDKGSQANGDPYCANYVDRSSSSTEPVLTKGIALTSTVYANRQVGLGTKDYSGYSIPNAFLATDLVNKRVAIDGTNGDRRATSQFARDYRLVAAVPMPSAVETRPDGVEQCVGNNYCFRQNTPVSNQARILDRRTPLGSAFPALHLCQHIQTDMLGYFLPSEVNNTSTSFCYLASSFDPALLGNPEIRRSPYDFPTLAQSFVQSTPEEDVFVKRAFPEAECRANPEADAPFPDNYVTQWDLTKDPPKPTQRVPGFTRVNVCERGEDCTCSYRRANYNEAAISKFYEVQTQAIPSGICLGGPRDGEGCVPGSVFGGGSNAAGASGGTGSGGGTGGGTSERKKIADAANASQTCGDPTLGGHCVALSRIDTVRGVFGQCLERDMTRAVRRGDVSDEPCLTWSPTPILFGDHDIYHYNPAAGYEPPPGSGQYYCVSSARKSVTVRLDGSDFVGREPGERVTAAQETPFAGQMKKITYDDNYVSDEDENKSGKASILGHGGGNNQVAQDCEDADDEQEANNQANDGKALRLVGTGAGIEQSYTEAFFRISASNYVSHLFSLPSPSPERIKGGLLESNIGYIKIQPFENPNGVGRLACGYQADWVDGLGGLDYDKADDLRSKDREWRQKFFSNYDPIMTRGSEKIFTNPASNLPVELPCMAYDGNTSVASNSCYFKFWQMGYRLDGQNEAFKGFMNNNGVLMYDSFRELNGRPVSATCPADKPYFGIRAVFQAEKPASYTPARGQTPPGPWRFVGFWVATCGGRANDVRYMYMNVDVVSADICKEIAEVRSKDSLQDAAFTDRVWKESGYTAPRVGVQYTAKFSPFSSILTSRPISEAKTEPLFQTSQDVAGFSPLNPPTFLGSGTDTFHRPDTLPKDKWAYLSNLFARVYRVYRYYQEPVGLGDKACLDGPFKGQACTPSGGLESGPSPQCSIQGVCDTTEFDSSGMEDIKMCDSMSGVNAGINCANDPDICHTGAVRFYTEGDTRPPGSNVGDPYQQLNPCVVNTADGWIENRDSEGNPDGTYTPPRTAGSPRLSAVDAGRRYLNTPGLSAPFLCRGGLRDRQDCSRPSSGSRECPAEVRGKCVARQTGAGQPWTPVTYQWNGGSRFVSEAPESARCAYPRFAPGTNRIMNATELGIDPVRGGTNIYVDGDQFVYDLLSQQEYTSCQADYDCSFTEYNYYYKRVGYPSLYSPRSARYMLRRGDLKTNYGPVESCVDSGDSCMNTTYVDVAACQGGEKGVGSIYTGGARRAATQLPSLILDRGDGRISAQDRRYVVGGPVGGKCAIQAWRQGRATRIGESADQSGVCGNPNGGEISGFEDALLTTGISYATPSEVNRIPGVASPALRAEIDRNTLDDFLEGVGLNCLARSQWVQIPFGTCQSARNLSRSRSFGRCRGGLKDGSICNPQAVRGDRFSCELEATTPLVADGSPAIRYNGVDIRTVGNYEAAVNRCGAVSQGTTGSYRPVAECAKNGDTTTLTNPLDGLDNDNNLCTHEAGYKPRVDLCPDPNDEFCGLIAYKRGDINSLVPRVSPFPLPTDVTMGHYTPDFLLPQASQAGFLSVYTRSDLSYVGYYKPQPPQIASFDASQCRQPGQCTVTRVGTFNFNGQTEGPITIPGGQHKSTIQFYGWAAHNQMPLRRMIIDWGDGFKQELPDAKIKNHKPYCGVTKECYIPAGPSKGHTGLTCSTDSDCPPGLGRCENMGTCNKRSELFCTQDSDCPRSLDGEADRCNIRTFFGSSANACESNYFEFSHLYTCDGPEDVGGTTNICGQRRISTSSPGYRCARNPNKLCDGPTDTGNCGAGDQCIADLAPTATGCWDPGTRSCRFTPRILIEDNWGWCTGECRAYAYPPGRPGEPLIGDDPARNSTPEQMSRITHPNGGCYAGRPLGGDIQDTTRINTDIRRRLTENECSTNFPEGAGASSYYRPWIVYPGSLHLRSR